MARLIIPPEKRFWRFVVPSDPHMCWPWHGWRHDNGYGGFRVGKHRVCAHRFAWQITHGPIPPGMNVCHRCNNPACVNPSHLFLGSQKENLEHMRSQGRHAVGSKHGRYTHPESIKYGSANLMAKLTEDLVKRIRAESRTKTFAALAKENNISYSAIRLVVRKETWKHIP